MSLPSSFDFTSPATKDVKEMTFGEKILFKSKQQPWVPIGCLLTTGAVVMAALQMRRGNRRLAQLSFRWRVAFQAATLVTLIAGSAYYGELGELGGGGNAAVAAEERLRAKAKMREQLWVQELERREQETEQRRAKAAFFRQQALAHEQQTQQLEQEIAALESRSASSGAK
ncbi:hypothetical protein TPHA_0K00330 [Tetrapisispora phaffii CBS 4417]|uniref:Respiratory supercomplex factor 1, mitochondrial n=1 Tax=Tetrapisispora phaffii (strain ATCC 24235 / CBS 4417 / NBRC 1672 / NRRL Y-8282 / UCD 70-5) TaxID=1071381 RepID=G8BZ39_TETPH|nr:hypothetical protein TPHA_0K00330 [Tetrapisispora phaffii CBS 4417]CCE65167.1 hypothetical protein TPHA_0K00330 [Tetrapisispora phaffii CBS 4417]